MNFGLSSQFMGIHTQQKWIAFFCDLRRWSVREVDMYEVFEGQLNGLWKAGT
jgi:hypothetical protein